MYSLEYRVDSRLEQSRFGWTKANFTWAQDKFHDSISDLSGQSEILEVFSASQSGGWLLHLGFHVADL